MFDFSTLQLFNPSVLLRCIPFFLLAFLAVFLSRDYVFFWDTIQLASKHAHWYFEQQFSQFLLPPEIDSGHPPTFGMYIALAWLLFGKTLVVSHFAMLPFVCLNIYLLYRIGSYFLRERWGMLFPLLNFIDPTLAAQSLLVSPDVVVMSGFLLGVFGVLKRKNTWLLLASVLLAAISMRGMMIVVVLYILKALEDTDYKLNLNKWLHSTLPFVPSGLLALAFLAYHYQETGWIGFHADSPWAASFERVDFRDFIKNIVLLAWRLLDFGRVFVWIPLLIMLMAWWRNYQENSFRFDVRFRFLFVLLVATLVILTPSLLLYKGLLGHRYLLPVFMLVNWLCLYLLFSLRINLRWLLLIPILGLTTGNLWIYPKQVAQGWDATLAHVPYYHLREKAYNFIEEQDITYENIGSVFPELGEDKFRTLSNKKTGFQRANLEEDQYIFYSNIMNDFSDEELEALDNNWTIRYEVKSWGIYVVLYQRKEI